MHYPTDFVQRILSLRKKGRDVKQLTPYQFRIDNTLDLYPVRGRFHNIKTGKRGNIPWEIQYSLPNTT